MPRLGEFVSFNSDFRDSVNLYLDLNKAEKINSYIPTKPSVAVLKTYLESVIYNKMQSTLLIGPYGKGKSHLLLLLLAIMSLDRTDKNNEKLVGNLANRIGQVDSETKDLITTIWGRGRYLPVLIMSTQGDLNQSFMVGLNDALKREGLTDIAPDTYYSHAIETINLWKKNYKDTYNNYLSLLARNKSSETEMLGGLKACDKSALNLFKSLYPELTSGGIFNPLVNAEVLPMYSTINDKLVDDYGYSGMIVIFDEFSKYIESQDRNSAGSNMKLLQDVCELANSSKHAQLLFSMVAHKSIKEYGKYLSAEIINSFTGIEGRIKEIYFITSSKNNYELIQNAIFKKDGYDKLPCISRRFDKKSIDELYRIGSFHAEFTREDFERIVVRGCYPLSPISAYLLLNVSEKVAQNERTLFTFISKDEPYSVSRHVSTYSDETGDNWVVGAPLIYDYFKVLFKKDVVNSFIHNIWLQAEYAISKVDDEEQVALIKTLAIISIVNKPDELIADRNTLMKASEVKDSARAIESLTSSDLIYKKASNNAYTFKTRATSELRSEIKKRKDLRAGRTNSNAILSMVSDVHYVLPKRYNDEFKMTRYFRYEYMSVEEFLALKNLKAVLDDGKLNDGKFLALYSDEDTDFSKEIREKMVSDRVENLAVVYSAKPLLIKDQIVEYDVVQEIKNDQLFFKNDENKVLERELPIVEEELEKVIYLALDSVYGISSDKHVFYFDDGKLSEAESNSLSDIADIVCFRMYYGSVKVNNELINKECITTAPIKKVRKTLIDQFLQKEDMDGYLSGTSAEATIYRALFVGSGLLSKEDENAQNALKVINKYIDSTSKGKKNVMGLIEKLTNAPIGMRRGVIPIYLAFAISRRNEDVVVYFDANEVQIDSEIVLNMCEKPEDYSMFISPESAKKEAYLRSLSDMFEAKDSPNRSESRIRTIVKGMQRWYRALPLISKNLKRKNEYWGETIIGNAYPTFKEAMQSVEVNSYEFLFVTLPEAFECHDDFDTLVTRLGKLKKKLSGYYSSMIEQTIKATIEVFDAKKKKDLTHTLLEWYEKQSDLAKHGLHSSRVTGLMSCIADNKSFDDGDLVKKIVRAITDMYMDSWNEQSYDSYLNDLIAVKSEIESLSDEHVQTEDKYMLSFVGKNGIEEKCFYSHVDENTGAILRNIISDSLEDFSDLSTNDKVAILLEMIEKELGK